MAHTDSNDSQNVLHPHITPMSTYLKVGGALFGLTILTVIMHQLPIGVLHAPVAFLIAAIKAALVLLYFMHLKDDTNMNRFIFGTSFFFLAVLAIFCVLDIATRVVEVSPL